MWRHQGIHSRLREVPRNEVGALEQKEDVAKGLALERIVHGYPVGILRKESQTCQWPYLTPQPRIERHVQAVAGSGVLSAHSICDANHEGTQ